ncbi:MAG: hypothetical protein BJ554DRAFT_3834, partial [Olpidium bornovanus]
MGALGGLSGTSSSEKVFYCFATSGKTRVREWGEGGVGLGRGNAGGPSQDYRRPEPSHSGTLSPPPDNTQRFLAPRRDKNNGDKKAAVAGCGNVQTAAADRKDKDYAVAADCSEEGGTTKCEEKAAA